MELLSPKERIRLEKRARKAEERINKFIKNKLYKQGWKFDGVKRNGDITFRKDVWILDLEVLGKK